jgi:hypothetical protein
MTFNQLKKLITNELVLAMPREGGKFQMEVDASGYTIGRVLSKQ